MNINIDSIMSKVSSYAKSAEGKGRMKEYIGRCRSQGRAATLGGSPIITENDMVTASGKLIQFVQEAARNAGLPDSVMNHLYDVDVSPPIHQPDGSVVMYISFSGDLHRDSLEDGSDYYGGRYGGYTGEGIDNIVALFNNGAHAKNYVYGWWNGHKATGDGVLRSGYDNDFAWVRSKKEREALHFIQQAVTAFNETWGEQYDVFAEAGYEYQK